MSPVKPKAIGDIMIYLKCLDLQHNVYGAVRLNKSEYTVPTLDKKFDQSLWWSTASAFVYNPCLKI